MIVAANARLRSLAAADNIDILAIDERVGRDGISAWHNKALWNHAKQDVSPTAAPMYGEMAARIIAARRGRSAKCLVLDLDNTLWGGVIGDDGLDGIVLGQAARRAKGLLNSSATQRRSPDAGSFLRFVPRMMRRTRWRPSTNIQT